MKIAPGSDASGSSDISRVGGSASGPTAAASRKRARSPGLLSELADISRPAPALRRSASTSNLPIASEVETPLLHEVIGTARAGELDARFGSLQPVRTKNDDGIHEWERDARGRPLVHPNRLPLQDRTGAQPGLSRAEFERAVDIEALKRKEKRYIWAVGAMGRVFVGEELPLGPDPVSGKTRYQGHPLLVAGGNARICGEFDYNAQSGKLKLINKSGRYSRYEDRSEAHLSEVASVIGQCVAPLGLEVETEFLSGKEPEPLILPNVDPARVSGGIRTEKRADEN
ncbi:type III effector protein [Trinickia sp. Y13]|uniref:type III effector protein n=1 Tax=Trinickia sp. Y13 TaxID=2917807 RepID=UPI0024056BEF|nr:type III effector protein [Trinickia sp. Y13]MDG0025532.1 type III effector protein [Trinickia sp. Y13]